jgi:hypothetical protein
MTPDVEEEEARNDMSMRRPSPPTWMDEDWIQYSGTTLDVISRLNLHACKLVIDLCIL